MMGKIFVGNGLNLPRFGGVQQVANLIVRRDLMDPKQGLSVVFTQPLVQAALVFQK